MNEKLDALNTRDRALATLAAGRLAAIGEDDIWRWPGGQASTEQMVALGDRLAYCDDEDERARRVAEWARAL
jgi:hypothetical protein